MKVNMKLILMSVVVTILGIAGASTSFAQSPAATLPKLALRDRFLATQ